MGRESEILAVENATAETTVGKLFDECICCFGAPLSIHSDQCGNYESQLAHEAMSTHGMST